MTAAIAVGEAISIDLLFSVRVARETERALSSGRRASQSGCERRKKDRRAKVVRECLEQEMFGRMDNDSVSSTGAPRDRIVSTWLHRTQITSYSPHFDFSPGPFVDDAFLAFFAFSFASRSSFSLICITHSVSV